MTQGSQRLLAESDRCHKWSRLGSPSKSSRHSLELFVSCCRRRKVSNLTVHDTIIKRWIKAKWDQMFRPLQLRSHWLWIKRACTHTHTHKHAHTRTGPELSFSTFVWLRLALALICLPGSAGWPVRTQEASGVAYIYIPEQRARIHTHTHCITVSKSKNGDVKWGPMFQPC